MPYDFKNLPDHDLKLFLLVANDLMHKANLAGKRGPLKFGNAPKGVNKDEQLAILSRLDNNGYVSFSNDEKSIYINENIHPNISFNELFDSVHEEYHRREKKTENNTKPHYDQVNGFLHIAGYKIRIRKHDEDTKQNQLLKYIFSANSKNIEREFDFTEFPFDDVLDKKKFKEICRTACTEINRKIKEQTGDKISDFLEFNNRTYGFLNINPKYLLG